MSIALAAALASAATGLAPGPYVFATIQKTNGRPVCTEQWTFDADGALTVNSGEEIARSTYRFERDRDGEWLVTTYVGTNGLPDCMGTTSMAPPVGKVRRTLLLRFNGGDAMLCPPPGHDEKGIPFVSGCFANLTRRK